MKKEVVKYDKQMKCYICNNSENLGQYESPTGVFYFCKDGEKVLGSEMTICKFKAWSAMTNLNYKFKEKY